MSMNRKFFDSTLIICEPDVQADEFTDLAGFDDRAECDTEEALCGSRGCECQILALEGLHWLSGRLHVAEYTRLTLIRDGSVDKSPDLLDTFRLVVLIAMIREILQH